MFSPAIIVIIEMSLINILSAKGVIIMTEEAFRKTLSDLIICALTYEHTDPLHEDLWRSIRIELNEASSKLDEIEKR